MKHWQGCVFSVRRYAQLIESFRNEDGKHPVAYLFRAWCHFWAISAHIIEVARSRAYERLSLETGSVDAFLPAQTLYSSFGFTYCGPFGDCAEDPHRVFMTLRP